MIHFKKLKVKKNDIIMRKKKLYKPLFFFLPPSFIGTNFFFLFIFQ